MRIVGKGDKSDYVLIPIGSTDEVTKLTEGGNASKVIGTGGIYDKSGSMFESDLKDIKAYASGIGE